MPHRLRRGEHVEAEHGVWSRAVKEYQKSGTEARSRWHDYCDLSGRGTRDPGRHSVLFLKTFFEQERAGTLPVRLQPVAEKATEKDPYAAPPSFQSEAAAYVRSLQTSSREWRRQWAAFCDDHGAGVRDPARHPPEFAHRFLTLAVGKTAMQRQLPLEHELKGDTHVAHDEGVQSKDISVCQYDASQTSVRGLRRAHSAPASSSRKVFAGLERKTLRIPEGLRVRNGFLEVIPAFASSRAPLFHS